MADEVVLRVEQISKRYGGLAALNSVSFELRKGEVLGLLGPNGAGKTTAVRILSGFFPPSEGRVWIGREELSKNPVAAKRRIGYLPESVNFYGDLKAIEFLEFVAALKGVPRAARKRHLEGQITRCGLAEVKGRLIRQLSKGFRQRLGLAQALIGDPAILILDEPTNGLDPKQIIEIRSLLRELSKDRTVILSSHVLPEVSMVCNRVLILNQGRVVASGTTEELEAGLKERREIFVSIGDQGKKDEAFGLLRALPGVLSVSLTGDKQGHVSFSLEVDRGEDLRPQISRLFVEHQIPLLEIRAGQLSLEDIFLKLVTAEEAPK